MNYHTDNGRLEQRTARAQQTFSRSRILPIAMLLLLAAVMMIGGCGGGDDATYGSGEVKGTVYTFAERAARGVVRLFDMSENPLTEPVEVDRNGHFSIFGEGLPERFLVVVTEVEPWEAGAGVPATSTPHRLKAMVEYSSAMRTNVTPLTSMVARYAMLTGETLDASNRAVGKFLTIWPVYSPSKLAPLTSEDLKIYRFSFDIFRTKWAASGLSLQDYLKQLAERARNGETTNEFGENPPSDIGSLIGKWMLGKIKEGLGNVGDKIASAGIGWISRQVFGEQPDKYMDKLNEISGKLDDIKKTLVDVGQTLEQEIKDLGQDIKLDLITAQINIFAAPLGWYDQLTVDMPYHSKRLDDAIKAGDAPKQEEEHRQLKDIASTITDGGANSCYNRTTTALGTMHDLIAQSHAGLGRSLYALVADAMTGKIASGALSLDKAMDQYIELFAALANAQLKGLLLQVEFLHKQHEGSDENCRHYVNRALDLYTERMNLQAEEFWNGLERMLVLFADGDSTRNYPVRMGPFPADGGSKYYHKFDSLVGDMVGAGSQVIVRLLWDAKTAEQYPAWFGFMLERMGKLENPAQELQLQLEPASGGQRVSPVNGKENGTVNPIVWKKIGESTETKAVVRRYIFRELEKGTEYKLTTKEGQIDAFNLREDEVKLPRSVGLYLLPYGSYGGNLLSRIRPYADDDHRYMTIPLFAWLPEPLILDGGKFMLDDEYPVFGTTYPAVQLNQPVYAVKSFTTGKRVHTVHMKAGYSAFDEARCEAEPSGALVHRLEPASGPLDRIVYGESTIRIVGLKGQGADKWYDDTQFFRLGDKDTTGIDYVRYAWKSSYHEFHILPAPTFVRRFVNPLEAKIAREGLPFRIHGLQGSKVAATGRFDRIFPNNYHDGTVPPEELFYFERIK